MRIWSANARNLCNKIDSVRETLTNRKVDFAMISDAALRRRSPPVINDFESFRADHKKVTRYSVMYVMRGYIQTSVRIREDEEETVSSEFIYVRPSRH